MKILYCRPTDFFSITLLQLFFVRYSKDFSFFPEEGVLRFGWRWLGSGCRVCLLQVLRQALFLHFSRRGSCTFKLLSATSHIHLHNSSLWSFHPPNKRATGDVAYITITFCQPQIRLHSGVIYCLRVTMAEGGEGEDEIQFLRTVSISNSLF